MIPFRQHLIAGVFALLGLSAAWLGTGGKNITVADLQCLDPISEITGGVIFTVEWSDTLAPNSWSTTGVTQSILTANDTVQSIKAPSPLARLFL